MEEKNAIELIQRIGGIDQSLDYVVSELNRLNENLEKIFEMGNNLIPK